MLDPLKMTLHAECKIISALNKSLKWFLTKPTLEQYSHQNKVPTTRKVLISAQLNIEVDVFTYWVLEMLEPKQHVMFNPAYILQLDINSYTITQNRKHSLS